MLAPIGCAKISGNVRQLPSLHSRYSPAAPELPSTSSGIGARGSPLKPAIDEARIAWRLHAGAGAGNWTGERPRSIDPIGQKQG